MINLEKQKILNQIIADFSKEEIAFSGGFLSGYLRNDSADNLVNNIKSSLDDLTIIYISETGNAKFLAGEIAKKLKEQKVKIKLKSIEQYRFADLAKEENLVIIASTHGEGEVPENGQEFFNFLTETKPKLEKLEYFAIGLGDKNYPLFCQAIKDIDQNLENLGGKKLADNFELDLDFEDFIPEILEQINIAFSKESEKETPISLTKKTSKNEFLGEVLSNINLNDIGSSKETHHLEIRSEDEIDFEPGDSIGILLSGNELNIEGAITPRLYSIASSKDEHDGEVHLTVSLAKHVDENGEEGEGLFSGYLSKLKAGDQIKFYISKNRNFKLPAADKNIIMVGPGTGIAPFRSFLAQRNYENADGKNWLFFGERNFQTDFLYQIEWQEYLNSELLTKMDVAFSRDQEEKIYVQDLIKENSKEIYQWLENGAYFYICGDKEKMAKDVENTLLDLIKEQGNKSQDQAKEYLTSLEEKGRFLKDTY